jgi:hypothetical protein
MNLQETRTMRIRSLARAALALALTAAATWASAQTSFTTTYRGGSSSTCGTTYSIQGKEPLGAGRYPVFVYIGGTGEPYTSAWAQSAIDEAVSRGYVAATVEYANASFGTCSTISSRARCIFNSANSNSAVAKLCARAKADCSKGVVTGGLSQGSIISVLSRNYDSRVRASFGQGTGTTYTVAYNLASCMTAGRYTQSPDRVRIINGEGDLFVGGSEATARASAQRVTGLNCTGRQSCFRSNGSGWYIVKHYEVLDLFADHCFMGYGGTAIAQCAGIALSDANYVLGNNQWGVKASVNFLKGFSD